jgi:hypothetical protein
VTRVEAVSNTSTVSLRVVGGDAKETSAWGYNWATLFLGYINTGTWPSTLGGGLESARVKRDSDLRMTALARTSSNCKRQIRPLVT